MQDAWLVIKWVWAVVFLLYWVVQVFAAWRLKGLQKKRSNAVLMAMALLIALSDAIRAIFFFENRMADRVGMLVIGFGAMVATIFLVAMFGESPVELVDSQGDAEHSVQTLNLS